jgi:diacylglycerol kinase family enzyme
VRVYATKYPGHGRRLAERAARNGADLVGAIGGDGTLNEVVDGVMRAGVLGPDGLPQAVVTILPLGTASDFHRSMAWEPNNFEEAMWRIGKRGNTAILDVARVRCASPEGTQDRHFINVASCGASARAALKLDSWRWMGQKTAYTMAGLGSLIKYVPRSLAVRVDGGDWVKHSKTSLLAVGNGSYFGNGLNICPDANPYDGQLQVVVGKKMTITDYLFKRHRLKMGKHLKMKEFTADSGMRIDVAVWDNKRQGPKLTESAYDVFEPQTNPNFEAGSGSAGAGTAQQHPSLFRRESSQNFSLVQMTPNGSYTTLERPDNLGAREEGFSTDLGIAAGGAPDRPAAREWSGSERSGRSGRSASTISSWQRSASNQDLRNASISRRSGTTGSRQQQQPLKLADYGAVPLEIDGEVIGHAPFSIEVLPSAIKFRV